MMDKEEWKDIKGYEGLYQISSFGRMRSLRFNKIKILTFNSNRNYYAFKFSINNIKEIKQIHRLVAEAFIPNPHNLPYINHKDGNKHNNNVKNLEWCTASENVKHAYRTGLAPKHATLQNQPYQKGILETNTNTFYFSIRECARRLGIKRDTIRKSLELGIPVKNNAFMFIYK